MVPIERATAVMMPRERKLLKKSLEGEIPMAAGVVVLEGFRKSG